MTMPVNVSSNGHEPMEGFGDPTGMGMSMGTGFGDPTKQFLSPGEGLRSLFMRAVIDPAKVTYLLDILHTGIECRQPNMVSYVIDYLAMTPGIDGRGREDALQAAIGFLQLMRQRVKTGGKSKEIPD